MKIGAQLYTVHEHTKTLPDLAEAFKKVADIGYRYVQVSGTCDYEPAWLKEQLEKNGFRLVARLTGIPSADGLQRFSFALRSLLYSGEWKVKKILASADAL